jgi:hypothetical protein
MNARHRSLTEGDARVLDAHILTLLIGEEHVGRETTFGRVGILGVVSEARKQIRRVQVKSYPSSSSRHRETWTCEWWSSP